jgi:putative ABC transport system permease protein
MKYLPLIWKNIWRRKVRTIFTMLVVFVAFLLFGMLMAVRTAFTFGVEIAGVDRLMMLHKTGFIMLLPQSYQTRLEAIPGVQFATHQTWFGGIYQDPSNFFAQMVVDPVPFMKAYPEFIVTPAQMKAWLDDRQGALVGVDLMKRFDWKVGQRIPINGTFWRPKTGGLTWEFNIVGTYDGGTGVDKTQFLFRYDYFDENRQGAYGQVGWYVIKIADASQAAEMGKRIDSEFMNSSAETKTATEKQFVQGFAKQVGDIGTIMIAIASAVLFNMLLVAASTMTRSIRERTAELAVLKTLGFADGSILGLVLVEALFVVLVGGGLGLGLAWLFVQAGDPTGGFLPQFTLFPRDVAIGAGLMIALGLLAGLPPAMGAMRLRITDALRRS